MTTSPRNSMEMTPEQRSLALMHAFGWQGGTIHQLAKETGCSAPDLLHGVETDHKSAGQGFSAVRTCDLAFNQRVNFPKHRGDLSFWLGVAYGQWLHENGVPSFSKA